KARSVGPFLIAAFLASWLAVALIVADGANFPMAQEPRRLVNGLIALIPFIIAVLALFLSKTVRAINAAMPNAWPVAIQTYRAAGHHVHLPFSYVWNRASRICVPGGRRGCVNRNLRADRGLNDRPKPATCS